jgi:hypothetical protein
MNNKSVLPDIIYKNIDKKILNGYNLPLKKIPPELNNKYFLIHSSDIKPYTIKFKDDNIYIYKNKIIYTNKFVDYFYDFNDKPIDNKILNNYIKKYDGALIKPADTTDPAKEYKHHTYYVCVKLIKKITKFDKIFIGVDPTNTNNFGNTFLIGLTPKKYLHISENIIEINVSEPILEYYSFLGNHIVPQSIALTKTNVMVLDISQRRKSKEYSIKIINKNKLEKLWKNQDMLLLVKDYTKDKNHSVLEIYYRIAHSTRYAEWSKEYKFIENLNKFIYDNKIKFKDEKQNFIYKNSFKQVHLLV